MTTRCEITRGRRRVGGAKNGEVDSRDRDDNGWCVYCASRRTVRTYARRAGSVDAGQPERTLLTGERARGRSRETERVTDVRNAVPGSTDSTSSRRFNGAGRGGKKKRKRNGATLCDTVGVVIGGGGGDDINLDDKLRAPRTV